MNINSHTHGNSCLTGGHHRCLACIQKVVAACGNCAPEIAAYLMQNPERFYEVHRVLCEAPAMDTADQVGCYVLETIGDECCREDNLPDGWSHIPGHEECPEGGPCAHPNGVNNCQGFQEGSCGCAWNI